MTRSWEWRGTLGSDARSRVKSQAPSSKSQRISKVQVPTKTLLPNARVFLNLGFPWDLVFGDSLGFGAWSLGFDKDQRSGPEVPASINRTPRSPVQPLLPLPAYDRHKPVGLRPQPEKGRRRPCLTGHARFAAGSRWCGCPPHGKLK